MNGEPILITGVGKRLGLQLALTYLERGIPVIGTYRSERPGLNALQAQGATLYPCDLSDASEPQALIDSIAWSGRAARSSSSAPSTNCWKVNT